MTTSNYPNLLEVYKSSKGNYLVVDRTLHLESFYCKTLEECLSCVTGTMLTRTTSDHWFHGYYYQGNHYTLAELQQLYPELLL